MNELRLQYQRDTGKSAEEITNEIEGFQHDVVVDESIVNDLKKTIDSLKADVTDLHTQYFTVAGDLIYLPAYVEWLEEHIKCLEEHISILT